MPKIIFYKGSNVYFVIPAHVKVPITNPQLTHLPSFIIHQSNSYLISKWLYDAYSFSGKKKSLMRLYLYGDYRLTKQYPSVNIYMHYIIIFSIHTDFAIFFAFLSVFLFFPKLQNLSLSLLHTYKNFCLAPQLCHS